MSKVLQNYVLKGEFLVLFYFSSLLMLWKGVSNSCICRHIPLISTPLRNAFHTWRARLGGMVSSFVLLWIPRMRWQSLGLFLTHSWLLLLNMHGVGTSIQIMHSVGKYFMLYATCDWLANLDFWLGIFVPWAVLHHLSTLTYKLHVGQPLTHALHAPPAHMPECIRLRWLSRLCKF